MSGCNWMFNNGLDDDGDIGSSKRMTRREAKKVLEVCENSHYGGYVYDYQDRQEARKVLNK